jgi:Ca2+-transporting ATPase
VEEAIVIGVIVLINSFVGFRQEYSAEQSMAALKRMAVPEVRVRRDGKVQMISARDLVTGDVFLIEAGGVVPADARLLVASSLKVQEAALTGESAPVEKDADALFAGDRATGDQTNMLFMGSSVTYGRGEAVVIATGMQTELGTIATLIQTVDEGETPLQRRLEELGRKLALLAVLIVLVISAMGLLRGEPWQVVLLTAVSLAVAAVPEGLPAVVAIALSLGAQRMLKRRALIRKLPAVETLGSVTVICSDKTGTLTQNVMTVTALAVAGERVDLTGELDRSSEGMIAKITGVAPTAKPALALLLTAGVLCNDSAVEPDAERPGSYRIIGKRLMDALLPRITEAPFDSERKRMTTVHPRPKSLDGQPEIFRELFTVPVAPNGADYVAFTKGAVDGMLAITTHIWDDAQVKPVDTTWKERILTANNQMAQDGMRVLGFGMRLFDELNPKSTPEQLEQGLIFIGLMAMIDPPRAEVRDAVATCRKAGIRTIMITGDHPLTAMSIGEQLGFGGDEVLTGTDLEKLDLTTLRDVVGRVSIFARVAPEHKLRIVEALQLNGHVVAMTGDGVNDAPALKKSDIGVAMGITGTDVSKEAADMVLLDDNFATIVAAVEEGRTIYDNIRKFIQLLLSCNSSELIIMVLGPLLGMPSPLLPLQILWMNLVTDGVPALALSVEPSEADVMERPPHPPNEGVLARGLGWNVLYLGLLLSVVVLGIGWWAWSSGHEDWQTLIFTTLVFGQLGLSLSHRSTTNTIFRIGFFKNPIMLIAVVVTIALQFVVIYVPFFAGLFGLKPLTPEDLAICLVGSVVPFVVYEVTKMLRRKAG